MDGLERIGRAISGLRFAFAPFPSQRLVMAAGSSPFERAEFERAIADGADPDGMWEGRGALEAAVSDGDAAALSACLAVCSPDGPRGSEPPLVAAIRAGREDLAARLLAAGASTGTVWNGSFPVEFAAGAGMPGLCEALAGRMGADMDREEAVRCLSRAVFSGRVDEALAMARGSNGVLGVEDLARALDDASISSALHPLAAARLAEVVETMGDAGRLDDSLPPAGGSAGPAPGL